MKKRPLRPGTQVRLWAARDARASLLEGIGVLGELTGGCEGLTAPSEGLTVCQVPVVAPDKPRPSDSPTTLGEAHPRARRAAGTTHAGALRGPAPSQPSGGRAWLWSVRLTPTPLLFGDEPRRTFGVPRSRHRARVSSPCARASPGLAWERGGGQAGCFLRPADCSWESRGVLGTPRPVRERHPATRPCSAVVPVLDPALRTQETPCGDERPGRHRHASSAL